MIVPMWFRRPIRTSSCFSDTLFPDNTFSIWNSHFLCLSDGRATCIDLVSMNQPRTILHSSTRPSANNFFWDRTGFLGIVSLLSKGRAIELIVSAMALLTLDGLVSMSGATPIESSIYMSVIPVSLMGSLIASSLPVLNGISSGRLIMS